MSEISRCPFCGGEASVQRCEHAFHDAKIRCAGCQAEGPIFDVDDGEANEAGRNEAEAIAAWNRRTPAPEGEAVAWRCSGCRRLTDDLDADHAALDAGGFLSCCPERDMKPLYASPAVPVGSGEPVARATCQDCGGHIEGWICQSCDRQFRENDAGDLVFEDQPVFPVGVSREEIARIIDPWAFSVVDHIMHTERASEDRDKALAKADAILAALRPADTGANHD